ncbi:MAG: hypothetical protein ACI964_001814, partial [Spirosomataceae bacterium]
FLYSQVYNRLIIIRDALDLSDFARVTCGLLTAEK